MQVVGLRHEQDDPRRTPRKGARAPRYTMMTIPKEVAVVDKRATLGVFGARLTPAVLEELVQETVTDIRREFYGDPFTIAMHVAVGFVTSVLAWVTLLMTPFTTAALGAAGTITLGITDVIIKLVGAPIRFALLGTSRMWLLVPLSRPLIALPGIVLACVDSTYVGLTPSYCRFETFTLYGHRGGKVLELTIPEIWPLSLLLEPAYRTRVSAEVGG